MTGSRFRIAALALVVAGGAAIGCEQDTPKAPATVAKQPARDTAQAGGDVAISDTTASTATSWLTDANILSLLNVLNARQTAAANVELQGWHSDSARAFAESVVRDHADLQHSLDSVASRIRVAPVAPALATVVDSGLQAYADTLRMYRGGMLDRAFVREQLASAEKVAEYADQLTGAAERPEVQALAASTAARVRLQIARGQALAVAFTKADSIAADSAASAASKRHRASTR